VKLFTKAEAIFDRILTFLIWGAGGLICFAIVSVSVDVILRYSFNIAQVWVLEIAEFILLYVVFLGTAWVQKEEGHVRIGLLVDCLDIQSQNIINVIVSILGAITTFVYTWYGLIVAWNSYREGLVAMTLLEPPNILIVWIIPFGTFLLFIQFSRRTYKYIMLAFTAKEIEANET
jgi:TRAP-type C4-dicarboxylate transport system permease small subunit